MEPHTLTNPLNTTSLQKTYPEVYREFFSSCDFVFSAPATFSWCGDIATRFGGLGCAQKIPRRLYVGLTRSASAHQNETVMCFERSIWSSAQLDESIDGAQKFITLLKRICPLFKDYHLNILSEFPFSVGLSASAAVGAASAYGATVVTHPNFEMKPTPLNHLIKKSSFQTMLHNAWKFRCITGGEGSSGYTEVTTALFKGQLPFLVNSTYQANEIALNYHRGGNLADLEQSADVLLAVHRLEEMFKIVPHLKQRPFDIALLSLGPASEGDHRFEPLTKQRRLLADIASQAIFANTQNSENIAQLYNLLFPEGIPDLWKHHILLLNVVSLQVISALGQVFHNPTSAILNELTSALNHYHNALTLLNATSHQTEVFLGLLRSFMARHPLPESYGAKMNGGSHASSMLFVSGARSIQRVLIPLMEECYHAQFPDLEIEWTSWRDGFESEGARVEHAPSLGIIHPLLKSGPVQKGGAGYTIMLYRGDGVVEEKKMRQLDPAVADIFLDEVREKVWCAGKPVSAEELPSQRMAIILLKQLAHSADNRIANTDLPRSSYTSYRNELQSKIISPLRKLVEKRLHKELALNIEGSLTKFHIVRGKDDLTIALRPA